MRLFSARLDINSYSDLGDGVYEIDSYVIDNTGLYFASDVAVGDIIYVSGLDYGYDVLRYQVSKINSAKGANLIAEVTWDMPYVEFEPIEPFSDAIIGARHLSSTTANIVDTSINLANEKLVADARNYQQILTNANIATNSSSTPDKAFVFEQEEPTNIWTIEHGMEKHPSVSIVDNEGCLIMGDVKYVDTNIVKVRFSSEFVGKAYLN